MNTKITTFAAFMLMLLAGTFTSQAQSAYKGDANGDGEVNIADVNAIIDAILGDTHKVNCDVNNDGEVNIADVNAVIDIIMGGSTPTVEHEWVDLGLPSGTLWATCNVGANAPEEYGDYFAWGETAPKYYYSWSTYKWYKSDANYSGFTKYCIYSSNCYNGFTDGKTELDPADDAATANWGSGARMPSMEQIDELVNNCTWQWTRRNGVNGRLVTGLNDNSIFLPAAGWRLYKDLHGAGFWGYYSSRALSPYCPYNTNSYTVYFNSGNVYSGNSYSRAYGFVVRAVRASQN